MPVDGMSWLSNVKLTPLQSFPLNQSILTKIGAVFSLAVTFRRDSRVSRSEAVFMYSGYSYMENSYIKILLNMHSWDLCEVLILGAGRVAV